MLFKLLSFLVISSAISAFSFENSELIERDGSSVLKVDLSIEHGANTLAKRDDVPVTLDNEGPLYVANILFGTEESRGKVLVDTGSRDLWVRGASAKGPYDPSKSSTAKDLDKPFAVGYIGGGAQGEWFKDDIHIGESTKVEQYQFGVVNQSQKQDFADGVLGLWINDKNYSNLPYVLKEQGIVGKAGYSILLNDSSASTGSILFGGIDEAKYEGDLVTVAAGDYDVLVVIDGISVAGNSNSTPFTANVDTGWTITSLPDGPYDLVYEQLVRVQNGELDINNTSFELSIGNKTFEIPLSEFAWKDSNGHWNFKVDRNKYDIGNLGLSVLRHLYLVFDLEDKEISFGQVRFTDESKIVPL